MNKRLIGTFLALLSVISAVVASATEEEAFQLLESEDWEGSIIAYEQCIATDEQSPRLHYNLGIAYYRSYRFASAEQSFRKALSWGIDNVELQAQLHYNLGNTLFKQAALFERIDVEKSVKYVRMAIKAYDNASTLGPSLKVAKYNKSIAQHVLDALTFPNTKTDENTSEVPENAHPDSKEENLSDNKKGSGSNNSTGMPGSPGTQQELSDFKESGTPTPGAVTQSLSQDDALLFLEKLERYEKQLNFSEGQPNEEEKTHLRPNW